MQQRHAKPHAGPTSNRFLKSVKTLPWVYKENVKVPHDTVGIKLLFLCDTTRYQFY